MSDFVDNTPVGGDTPSASVPAQPIGTPVAAAPTTPVAAPQPSATGGVPDGYVPSYRIREAREAAMRQAQQQYAQREAVANARMQQLENNLKALVGVQPPQNPEQDAIKQQFASLYPDSLGKLADPQVVEKLIGMLDRMPEFEEQTNAYWANHANQTMDKLFTLAQTGRSSPLTQEGKEFLHKSFMGYLQTTPGAADRYQHDPTVVDDFWKAFTSHFIEPASRSAAAATLTRVPTGLPQDTPSGNHVTGGPAKPQNLDERVQQAWAAFNAVRTK